jgi:diguanylate cyclase (GGDEF)-like protein
VAEARDTSGITTALILAHVEAEGGAHAVRDTLARIGRSDDEAALRDERTWWSWDTKIALFEAAADVLGDDAVTYSAGRTALERNVAAPLKTALRTLGSPSLVYSNIVRANHKFSTCSRMVLEEMRGQRARIRYEHLVDGLEAHRLDCLYNQGLLSCVPQLFDLPPAHVEHPVCALHGGEHCVYDITWQPQVRPRWRATAATGAAAVALSAGASAIDPVAGVAAVTVGAMAAAWMSARRRADLARGITDLQRELDLVRERSERVHRSLHALSSALAHDEVVARITEHAAEALGGYDTVLLLRDEDGRLRAQPSPTVTDELGSALERWAPLVEQPVAIDDTASAPGLQAMPHFKPPVGSLCAAPLRAHGDLLGVLVALAPRASMFLPQEVSVLALFAEQAAIALFNARLYATQQEMAARDPLTGLRNHRDFHETLHAELARCRRTAARFSVALLDLDGFKAVNDTAGHAVGDRLLQDVGAALERAVRQQDIAFRVGGDEFAVLLPETDPEDASAALDRVAEAVGGVDARVGVSWGVGTWPQDGEEKTALLVCADDRLYAMKRARSDRALRDRAL